MEKQFPTILNIKEIAKILPHRYPFLLVDRIVHLDLKEDKIIGQKNVSSNEQFFQGHFPDVPIMPGVLIIEALAQTGGILVHQKGYVKKIAVLLRVANARFRIPVVPGDLLMLHVEAIYVGQKGGKMKSKAMIKDAIAVEAELSFALVEKEKL